MVRGGRFDPVRRSWRDGQIQTFQPEDCVSIFNLVKPVLKLSLLRAKTYIMTTILEEPYMMLRKTKPGEVLRGNERYEGYCKDLTDAITKLTGIKFKIKPVTDGKYGSPDSRTPGGWNGE